MSCVEGFLKVVKISRSGLQMAIGCLFSEAFVLKFSSKAPCVMVMDISQSSLIIKTLCARTVALGMFFSFFFFFFF